MLTPSDQKRAKKKEAKRRAKANKAARREASQDASGQSTGPVAAAPAPVVRPPAPEPPSRITFRPPRPPPLPPPPSPTRRPRSERSAFDLPVGWYDVRPVRRDEVDDDVFRASLAAWPPPYPNDLAGPVVTEDEPPSGERVAGGARSVGGGRPSDERVPRERATPLASAPPAPDFPSTDRSTDRSRAPSLYTTTSSTGLGSAGASLAAASESDRLAGEYFSASIAPGVALLSGGAWTSPVTASNGQTTPTGSSRLHMQPFSLLTATRPPPAPMPSDPSPTRPLEMPAPAAASAMTLAPTPAPSPTPTPGSTSTPAVRPRPTDPRRRPDAPALRAPVVQAPVVARPSPPTTSTTAHIRPPTHGHGPTTTFVGPSSTFPASAFALTSAQILASRPVALDYFADATAPSGPPRRPVPSSTTTPAAVARAATLSQLFGSTLNGRDRAAQGGLPPPMNGPGVLPARTDGQDASAATGGGPMAQPRRVGYTDSDEALYH